MHAPPTCEGWFLQVFLYAVSVVEVATVYPVHVLWSILVCHYFLHMGIITPQSMEYSSGT